MDNSAFDILILGAGPAGISAALTAHARGRSALVLGSDPMASGLARAERIENYPGLSGMNGRDMLSAMLGDLQRQGIPRVTGRATAVMAFDGQFMVSAERDAYQAKALILAAGAQQSAKPFPGEAELLGRGVSYCATCDGMLYRGKRVAVLGLGPGSEADRDFLQSIGCQVLYFTGAQAKNVEIQGTDKVAGLSVNGEKYAVDGVFVLRAAVAASVLLPDLRMEDGHIAVGADMATSLPGVFAAGDCTGKPYQIARAVGQGNVAALAADKFIKEHEQ